MKMKNFVLYPYNRETEDIVENRDMLKGYKLVGVISNKEDFILMNKLNGQGTLSYNVSGSEIKSEFDTIVLCNNIAGYDMRGYVNFITEDLHNAKNIFAPVKVKKQIENSLEEVHNIHLLGNKTNSVDYDDKRELLEIKVPIVTILGLGENCDKFKIQMELYKNLVRKHYKVTVVSSNELGALFGFHTIPEELYEKGSFIEKVYLFNRYIKQLEKVEKPDLFIIGCPGEIMPINKKYPGHLSELPLVICNAIQTDIGILSLYLYQEISQDLISELGELCKRKFDVPVKFITIARQEYIIDVEREKLEYRFFDRVTYAEEMKTLNAQSDNFLNVSNESDYEKLTQKILFRLSQNPNIL